MFLENQDEASLHLTEAEDAARQIEHDARHQRAREKCADMAEKECSEVSLCCKLLPFSHIFD